MKRVKDYRRDVNEKKNN